jgi:hypothetical protein
VSPLPPEFGATLDKEATSLKISRSWPSFALAMLSVSDDVVSAESYLHDDNDFIRSLRRDAPRLEFQFLRAGAIALPIGQGLERLWVVANSTAGVRLITIPLCNGTGAYVVAEAWVDALGYQRLEEWLSRTKLTGAGPPPICNDLDP